MGFIRKPVAWAPCAASDLMYFYLQFVLQKG